MEPCRDRTGRKVALLGASDKKTMERRGQHSTQHFVRCSDTAIRVSPNRVMIVDIMDLVTAALAFVAVIVSLLYPLDRDGDE